MTQPSSQRSNFYQVLVFLVIFILIVGGLIAGQTSGTPQALADKERIARVYFIEPTDGAVVPTTFTVQMGAEGLTVEPAGEIHLGAGHFHILIDVPFVEAGIAVPADDQHKHFGQAQTSTELTLTPGEHVLRLQFANGAHEALDGEQYRDEITIMVE
jgi:hypothetical protein